MLGSLAMLAARCVEPDAGNPNRPRGEFSPRGKVSLRTFAERSGIDHKTVAAYLRTWDALAADGWVPSRDSMNRRRADTEYRPQAMLTASP